MNETLDRCRQAYSPALITLLESRLEKCQLLLEKLQSGLAKLGPELAATHETLVSILRSTSAVNTRSKVAHPCRSDACKLTLVVFIIRGHYASDPIEED